MSHRAVCPECADGLRSLFFLIMFALPAWGWAQNGAALVDYPTGDACLFCHRNDIGATWLINSHAWTIRPVGEPPPVAARQPAGATHVMGGEHVRALKQSGYGRFALWEGGAWREGVFDKQCAGCHTTGVHPESGEFSSYAIDCYACHGRVPEDHAAKKGAALLSKARKSAAVEATTICASCHLRGGRSKTTGRPYPHAYEPGADLFKDFQVDLRPKRGGALDDSDAHVHVKTRAVLEGDSKKACTDCHKVHGASEPGDADRRKFSVVCRYSSQKGPGTGD